MGALQRNTSARKILATARANLVGHLSRDDRVAATLKIARNNIVKFDPKRFASIRAFASAREQHVQRQAAAARQRRVERTLGAARDTLRRLAYISEIVHENTGNARVAPEAPPPMSRRKEAAPLSGAAMDSLSYRFEVLREALPQAMADMTADLRIEWRRENDSLRRELDVTHRELDLLRRTLSARVDRA